MDFRHYAADCMPSSNPILNENYAALFTYELQGGGSCLRLNYGFDVKLYVVG